MTGLRFSDALRLSWVNIAHNKKRSLTIILTISLLFGTILGFSLSSTNIEEAVISASAGQTGGNVYVQASYAESREDEPPTATQTFYTPEDVDENEAKLAPSIDKASDEKVRERAAKYGGEVVGYYWYYSIGYTYRVIDKNVVLDFIDEELYAKMPEGKIPVLMREDWAPPHGLEGLEERLADNLYIVGNIPETEAGQPILDGISPLNIILSQLPHSNNDGFFIIDDGTGKVLPFIKAQLKEYLTLDKSFYDASSKIKTAIVKFGSPASAVNFAEPEQKILNVKVYDYTADYYIVSDMFGTTLFTVQAFNSWRALMIGVEILLLVIAVIISTVTFAHLVDSDVATVALYRTMGASAREIYLIYFLYLLELCLFAVAVTITIALVFVIAVKLANERALLSSLQAFYHSTAELNIHFLKIDHFFLSILLVILGVAPLSLLLTLPIFSTKHIAKKMKED